MQATQVVKPEARRILLVDDEEAIRFATRVYLEEEGYRVETAAEMEEAKALLAHREYALVILDLRLSDTEAPDGLEVLALLQARAPQTRAIVLTAYGSPAVEEAARLRGCDLFLHKPQRLDSLAAAVRRLLEVPR